MNYFRCDRLLHPSADVGETRPRTNPFSQTSQTESAESPAGLGRFVNPGATGHRASPSSQSRGLWRSSCFSAQPQAAKLKLDAPGQALLLPSVSVPALSVSSPLNLFVPLSVTPPFPFLVKPKPPSLCCPTWRCHRCPAPRRPPSWLGSINRVVLLACGTTAASARPANTSRAGSNRRQG